MNGTQNIALMSFFFLKDLSDIKAGNNLSMFLHWTYKETSQGLSNRIVENTEQSFTGGDRCRGKVI